MIAVPSALRALTTVELLTPDGRRSVTICIRYQAMMLCWVETQVADGVPVSSPAELRRLSSHLVVPPASASYLLESWVERYIAAATPVQAIAPVLKTGRLEPLATL